MYWLWQMLQCLQLQGYLSKMRTKLFIIALLVFANAFSQVCLKYYGAKKPFYHPGETVRIAVQVKLNPNSCMAGMKNTYLYFSGCENILNVQWSKGPNNVFQKDILVKLGQKTGKAKITVTRNTDKESFFRQETLIIK
jgi:hypothetical protein